jgi:hypothetical protein
LGIPSRNPAGAMGPLEFAFFLPYFGSFKSFSFSKFGDDPGK